MNKIKLFLSVCLSSLLCHGLAFAIPIIDLDINPSPTEVNWPVTIALDGYDSDEGRTLSLYEIDFDSDGVYDYSSSTSIETSYIYTVAGLYHITGRITNDLGRSAELTEELLVYEEGSLTPVPEPSTIVLLGLGLASLAGLGRKREK